MQGEIVTKSEFAALLGVSAARVSQFISEKKISGAAIVGRGVRARIRVSVAREQLDAPKGVARSIPTPPYHR